MQDQVEGFSIPAKCLSAPEWEKQGNSWNPTLHFTGALNEKAYIRKIQAALDSLGEHVVAHYLYSPLPGGFSLELQFDNSENSLRFKQEVAAKQTKGKSKPKKA